MDPIQILYWQFNDVAFFFSRITVFGELCSDWRQSALQPLLKMETSGTGNAHGPTFVSKYQMLPWALARVRICFKAQPDATYLAQKN